MNGGGFRHDIAGGDGNLIATSVQSPNFVHGSAGWQIDRNGNAEFNSIIIPPGSGGNRIFTQGTSPSGANTGDLWINTSSNNEVSVWNGSAWTPYQWGTSAIASGSITAALIAANTITAAQLAAGIIYAGIVDSTTITGADFIAEGSSGAVLVYSGTPGSGNPPVAWITGASTDPYGNTIQPGIVLAEASGSGNAQAGLMWNTGFGSQPLLALYPDSTLGFAGNSPFILGNVLNRGTSYESLSLDLGGGAAAGTGAPSILVLYGKSKDGTTVLPHADVISPGGTGWHLGGALTDVPATATKVTAATYTNLSKQWPYAADDATDATIYRLTAWGDLTTPASSLQACRWQIAAFGVAMAQTSIAASGLAASTTYEWRIVAEVIVKKAGSSGTVLGWISGTISAFGANLTSSNSYPLTGASGGTSASTAAASTIGLQAEFANSETGQQVQCYGSTLERLGL